MSDNELALIQACQGGDAQAFGELYDKYFKKIYGFIYYKVGHREDAEDLVSDTFTKALRNLSKFDINKGSFSAWLYRIARNTVIDSYRTKKSSQNLDTIAELSIDNNFNDDLDTRAALEEIRNKLDKLNETQREIIILRVWEQLPYKEIADIVGKSEANCKMIFSRGIKELKLSLSTLLLLFTILINQNYG